MKKERYMGGTLEKRKARKKLCNCTIISKIIWAWGVVPNSLNHSIWKEEAERSEFEANLVYRTGSRMVGLVSKNQKFINKLLCCI